MGLLSAALMSLGACAFGEPPQKIFTLKEIFESAETNGVHLRPLLTAEKQAEKEISADRRLSCNCHAKRFVRSAKVRNISLLSRL